MNGKIIIVEGYLASGKSTFALQLSKALNVPYLIKDTFKIALCESISITNREEGKRFSAVTFDAMMYVTERFLETGSPIIIEGNFVPAGVKKVDEAKVIKTLINKYGYHSFTYQFSGDTHILYKRFIEREKTPERGQANSLFGDPSYHEFDELCRSLDAFSVGGEVLKIDTTDFVAVDYEHLFEKSRLFLSGVELSIS